MLAPAEMRWGQLIRDDGAVLRWGCIAPPHARIECVIVGGFAEFIEKYFELMNDLAARGIAVWSFDWRGQGLSDRAERNDARPLARDVSRDIRDVIAFTGVMGPKKMPRVLIAHSMGGAITLRVLAACPGVFDAAVLSAPMVAVATGVLPRRLAQVVASAAVGLGFGDALIPGLRPMDREATPEQSAASSDAVRCNLMPAWFKANPKLRIEGVTFNWYLFALNLSQAFADLSAYRAIGVPVLLGIAGRDVFVDTAPLEDLATQLPHCTVERFPDAKHELFHERDEIRTRWLSAIDAFLSATFHGPPT